MLELSDSEMRLSFHTFAGIDLTLNSIGYMHVRPVTRGGGSLLSFADFRSSARRHWKKASDWLLHEIFEPVLTRFEDVFRHTS